MDTKEKEFSKVLSDLTDELDIPQHKYADAVEKYQAVGNWLGRDESSLFRYNPVIYPQGSFLFGTCIKPFGNDEYDIDLVCQMTIPDDVSQEQLKKMVGEKLKANKRYKEMVQQKNRCWRLDYSGDFHMDILPSKPDGKRNNGAILVPDKELRDWKESNPKGYAAWFKNSMRIRLDEMMKTARAEVEDVPEHTIKTPLQRVVQILKRHRDIAFENDSDNKPISIIITTLAAKAYQNEADVFEALLSIVQRMPDCIEYQNGKPVIINPTNSDENFSDKWDVHPERQENMFTWLAKVSEEMKNAVAQSGIDKVSYVLNESFGSNVVTGAMKRYASRVSSARETSTLRMNTTGILGGAGVSVLGNTFYGE